MDGGTIFARPVKHSRRTYGPRVWGPAPPLQDGFWNVTSQLCFSSAELRPILIAMVDSNPLALPDRVQAAWRRFDEENARDPNSQLVAGQRVPKELAYARWLTDWVIQLCPTASEELLLAARCQHLCRWSIPRESFPQTRPGYLRWREELKKFHAAKAGEILRALGFAEAEIGRVQAFNLKKDFPHDPEGRVLEDALCLVFLQHQFSDLANKKPWEKMIEIVRKTWGKMTPAGQQRALELKFTAEEKALLERALAPNEGHPSP